MSVGHLTFPPAFRSPEFPQREHPEIAMVLAHFPLAFEPRDDKAETDNTAQHDLTSEGE
jgi:hypothetical protein